ncbi:hypothetical protein N7494_001874 [Penicillium frequentans]|uniref:Uncharacterized protein n=1 Tax=Penicillium frequentans TaxID=3151616 RepID=A0AAD6D2K9_9EURO|nr:hypothetical protein N7494_001874 [Penicillium glabrum]
MLEIYRREVLRLKDLSSGAYQADDSRDRAAQYSLLVDRSGEAIARHISGQPLSTARGYISAWGMCVPNDIQDYERDVLGGETNNLVRGLTSDQQVVDAAYTVLLIIERAVEHEDFDMSDLIIGTASFFLQCWRYNAAKQFAFYDPQTVRAFVYSRPPQVADLLEQVQEIYPSQQSWSDTYGILYDRLEARLKTLYWNCTCDSVPEGHENWALLAEALNGTLNEQVEEATLLSLSQMCIGASHGDIRCECALDLSCFEGFVRFFHPDIGLVPRMQYRTNTANGNSLAE